MCQSRNLTVHSKFVKKESEVSLQVSHLRECKPSVWWKEVKKLSGMSPASETRDNTSKLLQHLGFSPGVLANYINSAFLTPMQIFEPLTQTGENSRKLWDHLKKEIYLRTFLKALTKTISS